MKNRNSYKSLRINARPNISYPIGRELSHSVFAKFSRHCVLNGGTKVNEEIKKIPKQTELTTAGFTFSVCHESSLFYLSQKVIK